MRPAGHFFNSLLKDAMLNIAATALGTGIDELACRDGAVIARSESFYDDETFSGNNFGVVTIGNLTLQRAWIMLAGLAEYVRTFLGRLSQRGA